MTGSDAEANYERAHGEVKIFSDLLRSEFGVNAVKVAETQFNAAEADAKVIWREIFTLLHRSTRPE